jgi:Plasmid pRiA4b ORF-3-like protein
MGLKLISSFATRRGGEELIQVCSDLGEVDTKERELRALIAAGRERPRVGLRLIGLEPELEGIQPRIWRKTLVPGSIKLSKLHDLLQLVMGWTDSHLHSFQFGQKIYSAGYPELGMLDEKKLALESAMDGSLNEFIYLYDFGDSWRHLIQPKLISK